MFRLNIPVVFWESILSIYIKMYTRFPIDVTSALLRQLQCLKSDTIYILEEFIHILHADCASYNTVHLHLTVYTDLILKRFNFC